MTEQHPISVPQELLNQWCQWKPGQTPEGLWRRIADNAAQWGANQELEACCEWLVNKLSFREDGIRFTNELRAARRPKPPTLKKEALKRLKSLEKLAEACGHDPDDTIRLALEQLND